MVLGTPVISTSRGAEGLDVTHEKNILLADSPQDFARQIDRLLLDDELWKRLSLGGKQLINSKYTSDKMGEQFEELVKNLIQKTDVEKIHAFKG
jgi:glycosyltransferase involved in cell wall biosynthesis